MTAHASISGMHWNPSSDRDSYAFSGQPKARPWGIQGKTERLVKHPEHPKTFVFGFFAYFLKRHNKDKTDKRIGAKERKIQREIKNKYN